MNNIAIAKETIRITHARKYTLHERDINLPETDFEAVVVYTPDRGAELIAEPIPSGAMCHISVTNEDSFQAARRFDKPFVMNFANAHNPGGGFMLGANAQEEALCRYSTLYASISSKAASEMYHYNNTHISAVESDHMLYSPYVCVFRDETYELLEEPFSASVMTVPAPNRRGAAIFSSSNVIREVMCRRIRIMLRAAAEHGHKNLILGAWGCGAFGNDPDDVSDYFKEVIINEKYGEMFDEICFAIYGGLDSRNYKAFHSDLIGL